LPRAACRRSISSDECIARIERLEPRLHASVSINAADARLAAEAADEAIRAGHAVGPLHGMLTPTAVTPALSVASIDQNTTPAMFTRWVNFLDLCAAAVPNGFRRPMLSASHPVEADCRRGPRRPPAMSARRDRSGVAGRAGY
jgi:Asp-tRNA(Asn)/Glu-tRNA(Gln) amidotransferase A subunit family amidase